MFGNPPMIFQWIYPQLEWRTGHRPEIFMNSMDFLRWTTWWYQASYLSMIDRFCIFSLRHHQGRSGPLAKRLTRNKPIQIIWSNLLHTAHTLIHRTIQSTTFNEPMGGAWGGCWEGDNDGNGRRMQSGLVARQGSCTSTRGHRLQSVDMALVRASQSWFATNKKRAQTTNICPTTHPSLLLVSLLCLSTSRLFLV